MVHIHYFFSHIGMLLDILVTSTMLDILNGAPFPKELNKTFIVLIPKKRKTEKIEDLKPISLCNVVYKFVSKVLANMIKKFLPDIISVNQSAFVPDRLITHNILVAFDYSTI